MVYIHTVFFICPSVSAKNRPGLLLRKPGRFDCVICAFPSAHAITFTTFCLFSPSWGIKDTSNIFIGSIQYQSYLRLNDHLIQIMQPCWYLAIIFYPQNVDSNTVKMVFNLKSIF